VPRVQMPSAIIPLSVCIDVWLSKYFSVCRIHHALLQQFGRQIFILRRSSSVPFHTDTSQLTAVHILSPSQSSIYFILPPPFSLFHLHYDYPHSLIAVLFSSFLFSSSFPPHVSFFFIYIFPSLFLVHFSFFPFITLIPSLNVASFHHLPSSPPHVLFYLITPYPYIFLALTVCHKSNALNTAYFHLPTVYETESVEKFKHL
jgi:hypothetical protein